MFTIKPEYMIKTVCLGAVVALSALALSAQPNLVPNPQFETLRPGSATYEFQNPQMEKYQKGCAAMENLARLSPAQNWTIWLGTYSNQAGVMTELVKAASNCVPPWPNFVMGNIMHVKTTLGGMGIVNSDIPAGNDPVRVSCWVYVIKGRVNMSFGPTGSGIVSASSRSTCRWEKLEVIKKGSEACNQITLYSSNTADAEFYVDAVTVTKL